MTPLRALVVDDEPWARERLRTLLEAEPGVELAGESGSGEEAVRTISELVPDLVFLDIQMPDFDGFEVIARVGPARMPAVIFVTAHGERAIEAFEVHALDYLVKPFNRRRFHTAVERAECSLAAGRTEARLRRLERLLADVRQQRRGPERLLVRAREKMFFVRVETIDWIESAGNYVRVHIGAEAHLVRQTMKALEEELDPGRFQRIHRSAIVNLDRIRELQPLFSGEYSVTLTGGRRLTLSKSYRDRVLRSLGDRR